jgi:Putative stress-induced transcription regulator
MNRVDAQPIWPGTRRYGFRPAPPGGLALVQDFLNTRGHAEKGPDLLGNAEQASAWAANAMGNWSVLRDILCPTLSLTDDDAARLRELRDVLDGLLTGTATAPQHVHGTAKLTLGDEGELSWTPMGEGSRWLVSVILGEVGMSQENGSWQRMKQCRNSNCRATFYDSTWNTGGVCRLHPATSVTASTQLQWQTKLNKQR